MAEEFNPPVSLDSPGLYNALVPIEGMTNPVSGAAGIKVASGRINTLLGRGQSGVYGSVKISADILDLHTQVICGGDGEARVDGQTVKNNVIGSMTLDRTFQFFRTIPFTSKSGQGWSIGIDDFNFHAPENGGEFPTAWDDVSYFTVPVDGVYSLGLKNLHSKIQTTAGVVISGTDETGETVSLTLQAPFAYQLRKNTETGVYEVVNFVLPGPPSLFNDVVKTGLAQFDIAITTAIGDPTAMLKDDLIIPMITMGIRGYTFDNGETWAPAFEDMTVGEAAVDADPDPVYVAKLYSGFEMFVMQI